MEADVPWLKVNELLESILAVNNGDFVLSEVEADALLLYHKGKPIEADALVRQCLSMFESFHKQIKIIERDSLCKCGACTTASNLTLKFIAHHGMVQEIKVCNSRSARDSTWLSPTAQRASRCTYQTRV